jgi:hypothetical protein
MMGSEREGRQRGGKPQEQHKQACKKAGSRSNQSAIQGCPPQGSNQRQQMLWLACAVGEWGWGGRVGDQRW